MSQVIEQEQVQAVDQLTQRVAVRREAMVSSLAAYATQKGMVLFDGEWLTREQARKAYGRMRLSQIAVTVELILLAAVVVLVGGFFGAIMANLAGVF